MLILTRGCAQTLMIGHDVTITVLEIKGDRVRFGINAPREIAVERPERLRQTEALGPRPSAHR
jgi:carbon storage regulator